jgi:hypothetical protein
MDLLDLRCAQSLSQIDSSCARGKVFKDGRKMNRHDVYAILIFNADGPLG